MTIEPSAAIASLCWLLCLALVVRGQVQLQGAGTEAATKLIATWNTGYAYVTGQVALTYTSNTAPSASLSNYANGSLDFAVLATASHQIANVYPVPVAGTGMAMCYSLPGVPSTNLTLSREALAAIYSGNISHWNDNVLRALNPHIALPNQEITLVFVESATGLNQVMINGLKSFDPRFSTLLGSVGGSFENLPEAYPNRTVARVSSAADAASFLQANTYSLAYLPESIALLNNLTSATLINRAGQPTYPTAAYVLLAIDDFVTTYLDPTNLNYTIIVDGTGDFSYPLSFYLFIGVASTFERSDCTTESLFLSFLVWSQTNSKANSDIQASGYSALPGGVSTRVVSYIGEVTCDGDAALQESIISGLGANVPVLNSWSFFYSASVAGLSIQYFTSSDEAEPKANLEQGVVDYIATFANFTDAQYSVEPDIQLFPLAAFALSIGYNLPATRSVPPLNFTIPVLARIYLGNITRWNDPAIAALQATTTAALLPNEDIVLVLGADDEITQILSMALSAYPEFASTVGWGTNLTFPAQYLSQTAVVSSSLVPDVIQNYSNTIGALPSYLVSSSSTYTLVREMSYFNSAEESVRPSIASITSAMNEGVGNLNSRFAGSLVLGQNATSWPLTGWIYGAMATTSMTDCYRAANLVDWFYWIVSATKARELANAGNIVSPPDSVVGRALDILVNVTCRGTYVSTLRGCVKNGTVCSNQGSCVSNQCSCNSQWAGQFCDVVASSVPSSSSDVVPVVLATVLPVSAAIALLVLLAVIVVIVFVRRHRRRDEEWMIEVGEIEFGDNIGTGGYGQVRKATWRGTEVAVKTLASGTVSNDMRNAFVDEVKVMTALRHPNVVLFMGASTKAPNMFIVMEYMALGSLHDVLHNELIPDIPGQLKVKMVRQAAKGMYFLHSSGIAHRDLKSMNLLLDSKWNVKVSDFGLTRFKEQMKKDGDDVRPGSIHWTAPEVLNETPNSDYEAADVYSFGIILWEVLTRLEPYPGMTPAAVAVAVLRDNLRPEIPEGSPPEYTALILNAWDSDPTVRPRFLEILTRLESMVTDKSNLSSTSLSSWAMPTSSTGGSTSSHSSSGSAGKAEKLQTGAKPPTGEIVIVFTDIIRALPLWEFNPEAMKDATLMHNELVRTALKEFDGYEVAFIRDGNNGEGSFCIAFQDVFKAMEWCMHVQQQLLLLEWPESLLQHPGAAEEWGDIDDRIIFKGLRVRMGMHVGEPRKVFDPLSRRAEYFGPAVNTAARITTMAHGGQILISQVAHERIKGSPLAKEPKRLVHLGKFEMPDEPKGARLFELNSRGLEARFFGGTTVQGTADNVSGNLIHRFHKGKEVATAGDQHMNSESHNSRADSSHSSDSSGSELQTTVGDPMFKEDGFLTSANLCRWIIDFGDIQLGRQVGMGSYGLVFHGRWKGIEVAVKRFIKQKLTERRLLEFRAEMAFLSELHHPNIVLFIGACVKKPNLCIVTEFVKQGALRDLLYSSASNGKLAKLEWKQRLRMLRSAALGVNYLHTLDPVIIHRDLKSSNLLVDENDNVKVADFGFARLKEENATMTRCGTPCWTAPEVIRGERYSEKADVYSFGIIMWETVARRQPYAGRNFMGVSLDVLEGKRPQVPADCPDEFKKMMARCWHAKADKRPTMEEVIAHLEKEIGDGDALYGGMV